MVELKTIGQMMDESQLGPYIQKGDLAHFKSALDFAALVVANERLRGDYISAEELTALLPGSYYMDPPDGGDVSVLEQLRRMSMDAARFRGLGAPPEERHCGNCAEHGECRPHNPRGCGWGKEAEGPEEPVPGDDESKDYKAWGNALLERAKNDAMERGALKAYNNHFFKCTPSCDVATWTSAWKKAIEWWVVERPTGDGVQP